MKNLFAISDPLFFTNSDLNPDTTQKWVEEILADADDGDLYLEHSESEYLSRDDGRIRNASYDRQHGFGLRATRGEFSCLSHASSLTKEALKQAGESIRQSLSGVHNTDPKHPLTLPNNPYHQLYSPANPLNDHSFEDKITLLEEIDQFARSQDPDVKQVSCSLSGEWSAIQIYRTDGPRAGDIRPLTRLDINVTLETDGIMETGFIAWGGRRSYDEFFTPAIWQDAVLKAIDQARIKIRSKPAPGGVMDVVTGPGWTGVLLHEAIGHGLEADFHAKGASVFNGMMGDMIANPDVTIVDDATRPNLRGSLTCDDEGTITQSTTLIENGKLVGLMSDRQSSALTGLPLTGNGRRESYRHKVMPRMTNTLMQNGSGNREDMIAQVKDGIYAADFGGGQVDITSGQFVFEVSQAYKIRNGKIEEPLKGATLIGKGADALRKIKMVGQDCDLDPGIGICGKDGQSVPVGVGQPSLWIQGITVGGADV